MNARLATAALCLLALAGCSIIADRREEISIWRVDDPPAATAGTPVAWQLAIDEPAAAEPLGGARIVLKPADGAFGVYRGARWSERAPLMVQGLVLRSLEDSGRIRGVGRGNGGIRADYRLLLDLRAFHVDRRDGADRALVSIGAKLLRWPGGEVVDARVFDATAPIPGGGIAGVVAAFGVATGEALPALADWTLAAGDTDAARAPEMPRSGE
jgi:cholesterol transport system auxiliary component